MCPQHVRPRFAGRDSPLPPWDRRLTVASPPPSLPTLAAPPAAPLQQRKVTLTMEDLSESLKGHGVPVCKPQYYE